VLDLARALDVEVPSEAAGVHRARWNIAPTDEHWVVRLEHGRRVLVRARFGVQSGAGLIINARSETAAELRTFRGAFQGGGRCLVPADGFFEWKGSRAERRPVWFHPPGGGLLLFAGLVLEGREAPRFVVLTTRANATVAPLHDRMPALLSPDGAAAWLSRADPALLAPGPEDWLTAREVSSLVNTVANDGPELLESPPPEPQLKLV
jgi:putative SOS response-associated peptidase YedK